MPGPVLEHIKFESLLDEVADGVYVVDRDRRILYWNAAAERITGYREHEVVGKLCQGDLLMHCDKTGTVLCGNGCPLVGTMTDGVSRVCKVFLRHRHGHRLAVDVRSRPVRNAAGETVGAIEFFAPGAAVEREDIATLGAYGCLDELTGLPNRAYGEMRVERELELAGRFGIPFGWIRLELRSTGQLVHRYGHGVLDAAKILMARTLDGNLGRHDVLAYWGDADFRVGTHALSEAELGELGWTLAVLLHSSNLQWWGDPLSLAISVGVAAANAGDTLAALEARVAERIAEIH